MRKIFFGIVIATSLLIVNTAGVFAAPGLGYDTSEQAQGAAAAWAAGGKAAVEAQYNATHGVTSSPSTATPGMGVPDDEAAALESAFNSGGWDAFEKEANKWEGGGSGKSASATNNKKQAGSAKQNATAANKTSAEACSHDYEKISDTAREAFIYFTKDGKAKSCYLNIKNTSSENKITGKELNATKTGKEDGEIVFKDGKKVISKWKFSNWKSEDKYELDLTTTYEKSKNSKLKDAYELTFKDGKKITDNKIEYTVDTGMKNTQLYVYVANGSTNKEVFSGKSDKDGYITFQPETLGKYLISAKEISANK